MTRIGMVDLVAEYQMLKDELDSAVLAVLACGEYVHGANVRALEDEVATYCGVRNAVALASGTDALLIALRSAGIGPGDEVITTPFTFIATAGAITLSGARPVFVDIDPRTCNLAADAVEAAITARTRAVVPVHLFGQPADLFAISRICRAHRLMLIEDAAQAFGAEIGGRKAGAFGDAGCFSFYPTKNLGAFGDGGMLITDDDALAARARRLANHGRGDHQRYAEIGYNSRLDELQAAVLRVKLRRVDEFNVLRRRQAQAYNAALDAVAVPQTGVARPFEDGIGLHVYHQYTLRWDHRDKLRQALAAADIASGLYYPIPLHRQPPFAAARQHLPAAEDAARQVISLPISPLLSETDRARVVRVVAQAVGDAGVR